jgi:hypothetical protein
MSSVRNFTANWNMWYRVLRYRKGFGPFDSLRFGLAGARMKGSSPGMQTQRKERDYEYSRRQTRRYAERRAKKHIK